MLQVKKSKSELQEQIDIVIQVQGWEIENYKNKLISLEMGKVDVKEGIQEWGSVSFWHGSGSADPNPAPDPDPGRILTKIQSFEISLLFFLKKNFMDFLCLSKNALNT